MNPYLYCATELPPPADAAVDESEAARREREAARLDVAPQRPGDDPPTCGDEGGGSLVSAETPRPTLIDRLAMFAARLRRRVSGSPSPPRPA
jgi:hypothetical protein